MPDRVEIHDCRSLGWRQEHDDWLLVCCCGVEFVGRCEDVERQHDEHRVAEGVPERWLRPRALTRESPFDERERKAWTLIGEAFEAVMELDERGRLAVNTAEIAQATHVLQAVVTQHMVHRYWPEEFSDWWVPARSAGLGSVSPVASKRV